MIDRAPQETIPTGSVSESLRRLTQFSREIGEITDIRAVAERVLSGLSETAQGRQGSFYLSAHEHTNFRRLAAQGSDHTASAPPTLAADHPLVRQLTQHRQILDRSAAPHTALDGPLQPLDGLCASIAIPLINRGRLIAFVLLRSDPASGESDPAHREFLTAMAQSAANVLDSLLIFEDLHQSQTLMRRTDRLRSLETIAGGFAHEIRNPLTSIKTFIQLAPDRKDDDEFMRGFSQVVLDDVYRIERLIQEILDYARYMEPKLTEEDVNEIVSSCLYFIDVKARHRAITIEKELAAELPRVMLDRQQIKQVLLNLFLNSMDAIGESCGMLRVRTNRIMKPEGDVWVQIEVEDTGCGIPADNLERVFDPFFTTKHGSEESEGTGLGLAIAHQIVRDHRGDIHVQSVEGAGTTFLIHLPAIV
ncbi:MAG: ATP-binding protein [Nitrospira sp.]|nr:ATP-binding protein [Nitrospira sp.]